MSIYLDDVHVSTQDLYSPHPHQSQAIYRSPSVVEPHPTSGNEHRLTIVNTGTKQTQSSGLVWEVDSFVVNPAQVIEGIDTKLEVTKREESGWTLTQRGETGVAAMQLVSTICSPHVY